MKKYNPSIKRLSVTKEYYSPQEQLQAEKKDKKTLSIGIPKEIVNDENRVCLTPQAVEMLVANDHSVYVEKEAGQTAGFSNKEYSDCGAVIAPRKKVFSADIILQISPLQTEDIQSLKGGQFIISTLQAHTRNANDVKKLMSKKITALAVEHFRDRDFCYPVVRSMSEIAGVASINIAAEYLSKSQKGKGVLLGGVTGISPSEVIILGAGTAGEYAARAALGLGASVKVFDFSTYKLRRFTEHLGMRVFTSVFHPPILAKTLASADVILGALHFSDDQPRLVVTEDMVRQMKPGSVIIDLTIDKGGCFETSVMTTHQKPVYSVHNVVHYCVPNVASRVPRTASIALSNIFAPLILKIAGNGGLNRSITADDGFRNGIYLFRGILTNSFLGNRLGIEHRDIDLLLMAF